MSSFPFDKQRLEAQRGWVTRLLVTHSRRQSLDLKAGSQTPCWDDDLAPPRATCGTNSTAPRSSLKLLAWEFSQSPLHEIHTLPRRLGHPTLPLPSSCFCTTPRPISALLPDPVSLHLWCLPSLKMLPSSPFTPQGLSSHAHCLKGPARSICSLDHPFFPEDLSLSCCSVSSKASEKLN